jgi:hypothetical protein
MILFLVLLILAMVAVGLYAAQNTASHDVTLWNFHWSGVADWVPVVIAAGAVAALLLIYMAYAGMRSGLRHGALRRRITTHEATIGDLRQENQRLREENARLKSTMRTPTAPSAASGEPVATPHPTGVREPPAPRPEPGVGERVRAFLSGREPAGS